MTHTVGRVRQRTVRAGVLIAPLLVILAWPVGTQAMPAFGARGIVDLSISTTRPGTSAGLTFWSTYRNPTNPLADPPALRRLVIAGPPGTAVSTDARRHCHASDDELRSQGRAACPAEARVGSGVAKVRVQGGATWDLDNVRFNAPNQQIELFESQGRPVGLLRGQIRGAVIDATIPTCITGGQPPNGCPTDQITVLSQMVTIDEFTSGPAGARRSYLVTPPTCPASGHWQTRVTLYYSDGAVETLVTRQPCQNPTPAARCVGRRLRIAPFGRRRLRSLTVGIGRRRFRLDPANPRLVLPPSIRGRVRLTITAVTRSGRRLQARRSYLLCPTSSVVR
jgi:hypothetical protein